MWELHNKVTWAPRRGCSRPPLRLHGQPRWQPPLAARATLPLAALVALPFRVQVRAKWTRSTRAAGRRDRKWHSFLPDKQRDLRGGWGQLPGEHVALRSKCCAALLGARGGGTFPRRGAGRHTQLHHQGALVGGTVGPTPSTSWCWPSSTLLTPQGPAEHRVGAEGEKAAAA